MSVPQPAQKNILYKAYKKVILCEPILIFKITLTTYIINLAYDNTWKIIYRQNNVHVQENIYASM